MSRFYRLLPATLVSIILSTAGCATVHDKIKEGNLAEVKEMIEGGVDVNTKDRYGWTLLHQSAYWSDPRIARYLIDRGADVNARDEDEKTPLHYAAYLGKVSLARLLLDHEADVNARASGGETAVHEAAYRGELEMIRLLVGHGGNLSIRDYSEQTPLQKASDAGNTEVVAYLKSVMGRSVNTARGNAPNKKTVVEKQIVVGNVFQFSPATRKVVVRIFVPSIKQGETLFIQTSSGEKSIKIQSVMHTRANGELIDRGEVSKGAEVYRKISQ